MEMVIWQLRRDGQKLPRDELDGPHRGWLRMQNLTVAGTRSLHADLHASASTGAPTMLRGLSNAEVKRLDARGILLLGLQYPPNAGPSDVGQRQAWFCQPFVAALG